MGVKQVTEGDVSRRDVLKGLGAFGLVAAAPSIILSTEAFAQAADTRQLITPGEFLELMNSASTDGARQQEIQKTYKVMKESDHFTFPIRTFKLKEQTGTIDVTINPDLLFRKPPSAKYRAPEHGSVISALPSVAFYAPMHRAIYEAKGADNRKPEDRDDMNYDWRTRKQVMESGAQAPWTWDQVLLHLQTSHGAYKPDMLTATLKARIYLHSLDLDGNIRHDYLQEQLRAKNLAALDAGVEPAAYAEFDDEYDIA